MAGSEAGKTGSAPKNSKTASPTIKDIAAIAGVSPATVSLALNDSPLVAVDTAKRIKELAKQYEYRSNVIARRLSRGCTEVVTLFIFGDREDQSNWVLPSTWTYFNPILKGAGMTLACQNYHLQFEVLVGSQSYGLKRILDTIKGKVADGILLLVHDESDSLLCKQLEDENIPAVVINSDISSKMNSVASDNYQGACDAVNYLLSLGHKRIAHISGPHTALNAQQRQKAYCDVLGQAGIELRPEYILEGNWRMDSGYELMGRLLELDNPPTAVFCANDHMAIGALQTTNSRGLFVPRDISLVGFDDAEVAEVVSPRLTTVRQPLEEVGRIAAEEVLHCIRNGSDQETRHTVVPTQLIPGRSCQRILIEN